MSSSPMLMGAMKPLKTKQGCDNLQGMLQYMSATENMLGGKKFKPAVDKAEPPEIVSLDDEEEEDESKQQEEGHGEAELPSDPSERRKRKASRLSPTVSSASEKGKAKAATKAKAKAFPKDDAVLKYPGTAKHDAIKYGQCTIYIDTRTQCWRLKKQPGSKDLQHFYFKAKKPQTVWKEVVKETRKHA